MSQLRLHINVEKWPMAAPFAISGQTFDEIGAVVVHLEQGHQIGRGEANGVYYQNDTVETISRTLEHSRPIIEAGIDRVDLQQLLPPGGARNALDCALWDLEAKQSKQPVWALAGLPAPRPLMTTFTCGADSPATMAARAINFTQARAIKLKLTGDAIDAERVRAVRDARPDVWLGVDANQGFSIATLDSIMGVLVETRVALIEQPLRVGEEHLLDAFQSPIPIAADESVQCLTDLPNLVGRFDIINIKLDKCGGLTEGLAMARAAKALGMELMVGNMLGTSLAMAPAFVLGQLCSIVDLDGPALLRGDRKPPMRYNDGYCDCSEFDWGQAKVRTVLSKQSG